MSSVQIGASKWYLPLSETGANAITAYMAT